MITHKNIETQKLIRCVTTDTFILYHTGTRRAAFEVEMDFAESMWELLDEAREEDAVETKIQRTDDVCEACGSGRVEMVDAHCTFSCMDCGHTKIRLNDTTVEWSQSKFNRMTSNVHSSSQIMSSNRKMNKLNNWNGGNYKMRTLANNQAFIEQMCSKHDIDVRTIHSAKTLYKLTTEIKHAKSNFKTKIYRGNNRKSVMAACLFFGSKLDKVNLTHKQVCRIFDISEPDLSKGKKIFMNDLRKDENNAPIVYELQVSNPMKYIETIAKLLQKREIEVTQEMIRYCEKLIRKMSELYITSEHHDDSVACAAIRYTFYKFDRTLSSKLLSEIRDISEITIVRIYDSIMHFDRIINDDALFDEFIQFRNLNIQLSLLRIQKDEQQFYRSHPMHSR